MPGPESMTYTAGVADVMRVWNVGEDGKPSGPPSILLGPVAFELWHGPLAASVLWHGPLAASVLPAGAPQPSSGDACPWCHRTGGSHNGNCPLRNG